MVVSGRLIVGDSRQGDSGQGYSWQRLWRVCVTLASVLILSLALLLAGLRLATPWIEQQAGQWIEQAAPETLRIALDELRLNWWGWGPVIDVRGLRIDHRDAPLLIADRFMARFDITTSLRERRLAWDRIELSAEVLSLVLDQSPATSPFPIDWLRIGHAELRIAELRLADGRSTLSHLTATLSVDRDGVHLRLDSTDAMLTGASLRQPILLEHLGGELRWQAQSIGWQVWIAALRADNADLHLSLQGSARQYHDDLYLDLAGAIRVTDVGRIPGYPSPAWNPGLIDWLEQSLQAGRVDEGHWRVRGRMADFPFESGPGEFHARLRTTDTTLVYHPDWPVLEHMRAEVDFRGRRLDIAAEHGSFDGHRLLPTRAVIENLGHARLRLTGHLTGRLTDMRRTVLNSPLRDRLQAYLDPLPLDGPGELQLVLDIPLVDEQAIGIEGTLAMNGASVLLEQPAVLLEAIRGAVDFSAIGLERGQFELQVAGEPARLQLSGDDSLALHAELTGNWAAEDLRRTPLAPLANWLDGRSEWRIALSVPRVAAGRYRLALSSDLAGTRVLLPGNLGKPAEQRQPLRLQLEADSEDRYWRLDYGPVRALRLEQAVDDRVRMISGVLDDAVIGGYSLGSVALFGHRDAGGLQIVLDGARLQGRLAVPAHDDAADALWLALDHLNLVAVAESEHDALDSGPVALWEPQQLPPIVITVTDLRWGGRSLGQLTLQGEPRADGYRLTDLQLHDEHHRLYLQGLWRTTPTRMETALQAELIGDGLDHLLTLFDLGGVEQAATRLRFGVRWPGSPMTPQLSTMQGEFDLRIGAGTLVAVEPGLGRLLGLLNLTSLQRRLQLDFADLTESGLAFDGISGRLSLHDARLSTDDLVIIGPAARLAINGLLDMGEQRIDQVVTIRPEVGLPLVLAGTLAGGPAVGAAVFFADQLLKDELDQLVSYRYALTGDWNAIRIEPVRSGPSP